MSALPRQNLAERIAEHLRADIAAGRRQGHLPGIRPLAAELGVSVFSLAKALRLLEGEKLVAPDAPGHPRKILPRTAVVGIAAASPEPGRGLRVALLLPRRLELEDAAVQTTLFTLFNLLQQEGHTVVTPHLPEGMDPRKTGRLARLFDETPADAWIVSRGTFEVLEWFSRLPVPTLALGGRGKLLPMASTGTDVAPAVREAVRALVATGHRRIVCLCPARSLEPSPAGYITAFREELAAAGIAVGEYNTPHWEETPEGCHRLLTNLFRVTPPTALLCCDNLYATGALMAFAKSGIRIPQDVSLFSLDDGSFFRWSSPGMEVARTEAPLDKILRRIVHWVNAVATGTPDREHRDFPAVFVPGNTFGPAKKN